jgi:hypothetical protein
MRVLVESIPIRGGTILHRVAKARCVTNLNCHEEIREDIEEFLTADPRAIHRDRFRHIAHSLCWCWETRGLISHQVGEDGCFPCPTGATDHD